MKHFFRIFEFFGSFSSSQFIYYFSYSYRLTVHSSLFIVYSLLTKTVAALQGLALLNGKELNAQQDAIVSVRVSLSDSSDNITECITVLSESAIGVKWLTTRNVIRLVMTLLFSPR